MRGAAEYDFVIIVFSNSFLQLKQRFILNALKLLVTVY